MISLGKDDFKYLGQEFDNNILDLVKQKGFYPYEYMNDFEKINKELLIKEKFYGLLSERCEHVLSVWNELK